MVGPWSDIKSKIPRLAASLQGLHCLQMSHVGVLNKQTFIMTNAFFSDHGVKSFSTVWNCHIIFGCVRYERW